MLASVVNEAELDMAIEVGCDIIDLKNPQAGALGALSLESIRRLVVRCGGRRPVSATVGDLPADPERLTQAIGSTAECGVDYVKVGFFSDHRLSECLQAIAGFTRKHAIVAVLFADRDPVLSRLSEFAAAGFQGIMLDTAGKSEGGLLEHMDSRQIGHFVAESSKRDLFTGLAGSLRLDHIPQLLPLAPGYLGFRGALCEDGQRRAGISTQRLREIRDAVYTPPGPSARARTQGEALSS
jgi:dihydroneopterin aldolase